VELAEIFTIDVKLITRGVKQFSGLLEEHLHSLPPTRPTTIKEPTNEINVTPSTSYKHYIEPAVYRLELPRTRMGEITALAFALGSIIDELGICPESTPASLAACALSLACEHLSIDKPLTDISKSCTISAATLQKSLKRAVQWKPVIYKALGEPSAGK
jgi:hypothetical protein